MKQAKTMIGRALMIFALLVPIALTTEPARAQETIECGGDYGWSYGEPFYNAAGIWSITVTAFCDDGSVELITGPVDSSGSGLGSAVEAQNISGYFFMDPEPDTQ